MNALESSAERSPLGWLSAGWLWRLALGTVAVRAAVANPTLGGAIAVLLVAVALVGIVRARATGPRSVTLVVAASAAAGAEFALHHERLVLVAVPLTLAMLAGATDEKGQVPVARLLAGSIVVQGIAFFVAGLAFPSAGQGAGPHGTGAPSTAALVAEGIVAALTILLLLKVATQAANERAALFATLVQARGEANAARTEAADARAQRDAAETNFRRFSDSTSDFVSIVDRRGIYRFVSSSFARGVGRSAPDIVGRSPSLFLPPEDMAKFAAVATATTPRVVIHKVRVVGEAGVSLRSFESTVTPVEANGETLRFVISRDVTDRLELAAQLRHAQRMDGIGQLAGGIAHDFNNLAMAIRSYSELVAAAIPAGHPAASDLREIRSAADRAGALTRQLLAFARKQVLTAAQLAPGAIVENVGALLRTLLPSRVQLQLLPPTTAASVLVDRAQIDQILINLVVNAGDAMPGGGTVTFEVAEELLDAAAAARLEIAPGSYVAFCVRDSGMGMSEEVLSRALEPFFTTKPPGKGTGLGLSTCDGIARQHGGALRLESTVGKGTRATLLIPAGGPLGATVAVPSSPRATSAPTHRPAVLLVEDEAPLRRAFLRQLTDAGFDVVAAATGEEALGRIDGQHFDAVVTDVMMPGIGGRDVVEYLLARQPYAAVIYMSGYVDDDVLRREGIAEDACFLQKPFAIGDLVEALRAAI